jgi:hypothetical protein
MAGGLFAHSHQATQAFRKDGFETIGIHEAATSAGGKLNSR